MRPYGIKGNAAMYQWLMSCKLFGVQGLQNYSEKTFYDYSFKIEVIKWDQVHHTSYPATTEHFRTKNPVTIWDWERNLVEEQLKPFKGRSSEMPDKSSKHKTNNS